MIMPAVGCSARNDTIRKCHLPSTAAWLQALGQQTMVCATAGISAAKCLHVYDRA